MNFYKPIGFGLCCSDSSSGCIAPAWDAATAVTADMTMDRATITITKRSQDGATRRRNINTDPHLRPPFYMSAVSCLGGSGRRGLAGHSICHLAWRGPPAPPTTERNDIMTQTMRAAVVRAFGHPLTFEKVPIPTPKPGHAIHTVFTRLRHGAVQGRVVLQIG